MGKGDKKTKRGKIVIGSFGVRRPRKKSYVPVTVDKLNTSAGSGREKLPEKEAKVHSEPIAGKETKPVKEKKEPKAEKTEKIAKPKKEKAD
jgi:30S ribosomal protein S31